MSAPCGHRGGVVGWSGQGPGGEWRFREVCRPGLSAVEISKPLGTWDCRPLLLGKRGPRPSARAWDMNVRVSRASAASRSSGSRPRRAHAPPCSRTSRAGRPPHRPRLPLCPRLLQWCLVHRPRPRPGLNRHQRSPEAGRRGSRRGVRGHIWTRFDSR